MLWKCCTQYASIFRQLCTGHRTGKGHFTQIPKKGNAKECLNYHTVVLSSHASKVMFKILQAQLQQYVNRQLPEVQAGFRKGRRTRDQIANIHWLIEKAREFQKTSTSASLTTLKPLTVWITTNLWNILIGISDHLTCLLRNLYAGQKATVRTGHGTMDSFRIGKGVCQAVYCHPAYLTYMQSTSYKIWAG